MSRRDVNMIMNAFQASWSRLSMKVGVMDFRELSFQLVGRLIDASERMEGVKRCLDSARKWTRRPWALPVEALFETLRESVEEVYVDSSVKSVALLPDPNKVIVGVESGEVLLVDVRLAEVVKRYAGHTGSVTSVAVSRNGRGMGEGWAEDRRRIGGEWAEDGAGIGGQDGAAVGCGKCGVHW